MIRIKRAYDPVSRSDGDRFLVDRLWPRGIKKAALHMTGWIKDAAPSAALRRWFNHDPSKWEEFQRRYRAELEIKPEAWLRLLEAAKNQDITLLFSTRDPEHSNALVLRNYLNERLRSKKTVARKVKRHSPTTTK